ncbi:MAG: rod-binding protein [Brevinema sp.]
MTIMNQQALASMNRSRDHEFSQLKNKTLEDNKITEVAREFESLFIEMMFKEMRKTLDNTDLSGVNSPGKDIFNDMLYTEYSKETSKLGGFGLAEMIEDSLRSRSL